MALPLRKLKLEKRKKWVEVILDVRFKITFVLLLCVLIGVGLPVYISQLFMSRSSENVLVMRCQLEHELRIDCLPGAGEDHQNKQTCENAGCCWNVFGYSVPSCYHSHPTNYTCSMAREGDDVFLTPNYNTTPLENSATNKMRVKVEHWSENHLRISMYDHGYSFETLKLYNYEQRQQQTNSSTERLYDVSLSASPYFYLQVRRKNSGNIPVFNTYFGPLIFSEYFSEVTSLLPSFNIYGIGQSAKISHRHNLKYANRFVLFSKTETSNVTHPQIYMASGVHPFYMVIENDSKAHGVLLVSSSPVEIVTRGSPSVTFRTSASFFDFHMFFGPTPGDVVKQLTDFVGKPKMPPYWSLGYHACRNEPDLTKAFQYLNFTREKGIPHESDCGSTQLLSSAFAVNSKLRSKFNEFYELLNATERKLILVQTPHVKISSDFGEEKSLCVTDASSGKPLVGYLPSAGKLLYPDFFNVKIIPWLKTNYQSINRQIKFDGLILNMNTPANFNLSAICGIDPQNAVSSLNNYLSNGTICMNALHANNQIHMSLHNIYGYKHALTVRDALQAHTRFRNSRKFISSLSTFTGSGAFSSHWGGLVQASWDHMKQSLIQMLDFSLFGIPLNGLPACGSSGPVDVDLCTRWLQLSAFQPLMMTYRVDGEELLGKNRRLVTVAASMIQLRYSLLPYLYTLFYRAELHGETVVRPVFFEFPDVPEALGVDEQFMWGSGLLVSPVMQPATQKTRAYFPPGCWFDYYTGRKAAESKTGIYKELIAIEYHVNLHVRGGHVVPSQEGGLTTRQSRQNAFALTIALRCLDRKSYEGDLMDETVLAFGELFVDDGVSENSIENEEFLLVNITVRGRVLTIEPKMDGRKVVQTNPVSTNLELIHIYGFQETPLNLIVDGHVFDHVFKPTLGILSLHGLNLDLTTEHTITWESEF